jgi:uncharacterized protein YjbJ (UPF0337 family)
MSSRVDEIKGKVKQSIGSLTGNDDTAREGEAEATKAKAEREAGGMVDQTVGTVEEKVGQVTDDKQTELEGKGRKIEGDIERTG